MKGGYVWADFIVVIDCDPKDLRIPIRFGRGNDYNFGTDALVKSVNHFVTTQ